MSWMLEMVLQPGLSMVVADTLDRYVGKGHICVGGARDVLELLECGCMGRG